MKTKQLFALLAVPFLMILACSQTFELPQRVTSPDGSVEIVVNLDENRTPAYSVKYQGEHILVDSELGIDFSGQGLLSQAKVFAIRRETVDEVYDLVAGKTATAHNHANELRISFQEPQGNKRRFDVVFRAYNDGAAFRYEIPKQSELQGFAIREEKTQFNFVGNYDCWALRLPNFRSNYENEFQPLKLSQIAPEDTIGLPLTVQVEDGPTLCVTEAALVDYAGMYLRSADSLRLTSMLSPLPDDSVAVRGETPFATPWRVIMIADEPTGLIESNLITHLNQPIQIDDPSWIKPGIVAWDWWSGQVVGDPAIESGMNNETMKYYIDFAGENGWEYMLVDAGWYGPHRAEDADILTTIPEIDIKELVQYGEERDVDIMLWLNWASLQNMHDEAFALYQKWGVKGVKIDYMDRDDQEMVNFYVTTVKKAAEYKLLVDFHGAYKPTGIRRTWPNLMTREGILGLEYLKWSDRTDPEHNVTVPFTRMVTGPMDYTPGGFLNVYPEDFEARNEAPMTLGTRCHQLAMYVVYESPLQMAADSPAHYRNEPGLSFINEVPASWDETRGLAGEIGNYIALARRSGDTWFIGAMTDWDGRELDLSLDFLGEDQYDIMMFTDGPGAERNPQSVAITHAQVTAEDVLSAEMAKGGGFAAILRPAQ